MKTDLITLLENKDFEALTQEEKAAVLIEMTEKEFRAKRNLIKKEALLLIHKHCY